MAGLFAAVSCANLGTPSGGPRDEDPPRLVGASPLPGATGVVPSKVVLTFNELVNVKDAFSKVVVSPPSAQTPRVSSQGRRVTVEFRDTLEPETTYTIDFGDAIVDNNEGNKLENFIYTFSTGPELDTLMVSGMVLGAADLTPAAGMYVGLHSNPADSAFRKQRFERVAKTDEEGRFVIGGLPAGRYRIYALDDRDGDLAWSSPDETLAFYDTVIEPTAEQTMTSDTVKNLKTGEVDTVVDRLRTRFLPNNILLRSYNTGFAQQYITKYERPDSATINLQFNAASETMPGVELLLPDGRAYPAEDVAVTERSATNDTLLFRLRSPEVIQTDTLRAALRYYRADSAYNMVAVYDTLRLVAPRASASPKRGNEKSKKKAAADTVPPPIPTLKFTALTGKPEINTPIVMELPEPPGSFDFSMVHLEWKEDSTWYSVEDFGPANIRGDTLKPRRFYVDYPWRYETGYRLTVDSLAAQGMYGYYTDPFKLEFTTRPESDYGSLKFNITDMGTDSLPRYVDLLDAQGRAIRTLPLEDGSVTFSYLLPGKYNARVVVDRNGNGRWDPGNFDTGLQPDVAYYYKETIDLKANWDQENDWAVFATPVDRMVPETLRKKTTKR